MPFLPFEAVDSNGRTIRGTMQANSPQELEKILLQKGLRMVGASASGGPVPVIRPPQSGAAQRQVSQPQAPRPQAPVSRPTERPSPPVAAPVTVAADPVVEAIKTPELSNKEIYFLFSQFASFFRAGFSASQMIQHTTSKAPPKLRAMFAEMENEVAAGGELSKSMAKRPIAFTPDMVATVEAGEKSGQLGEAYDVIAQQADRAKAFGRSLNYFYFMAPLLLLCGIGGIGLQKASQLTIRRQFDADGQLPQVGTLLQEVKKQLPNDFLKGFLIAGAFILFVHLFNRYRFRRVRHTMGLWAPIGHSRAKSEAIERFTWSMGTMLKGGASPASAVHTAASSIPNMVLREKALEGLGATRENEPLGSVLQKTGLLGPEYVHIAQNGELTGDTPGALASIMNAEASQVQTKSASLNVVIVVLTTIAMGIFTIFMVAFLYKMYATGLIKLMLEQ